MKILLSIAILTMSWTSVAHAQGAHEFVAEYIRELGAIESIRSNAEKESKGESTNAIISGCIRSSERFQLEIRSQISNLQRFSLRPPFDTLVSNITQFYESKKKIWQQLSEGCSEIIAGPKPNVDYGKIAAEAPKLNAQLEYVDKALFEATPLIFATLIDEKENSQHHVNHLIITKSERDKLVRSLDLYFGQKLKAKDQNYTVAAASVLKTYLAEKGYKCSDEPW